MMQFLRIKGRRKSQRQMDMAHAAMVMGGAYAQQQFSEDVIDPTTLSDEEAAEIQQAFQQQRSDATAALDELDKALSEDDELLSDAPDEHAEDDISIVALAALHQNDEVVEIFDGEHVDLAVPCSEDYILESAESAGLLPEASELPNSTEVPEEKFLAEAASASDVSELSEAMPTDEGASEFIQEEPGSSPLAVQEVQVADLLDEVSPSELSADITSLVDLDAPLAVQASSEMDTDLQDEASQDEPAVESANSTTYEQHQSGPLTYFQYYLDEDTEGGESDDASPAPYVTPWQQPAVPRGLIGAGVLGATLVSGFVIADTVKTPSFTAIKKPSTPRSPLKSLDPKAQTTAMAIPQTLPPETLSPESTAADVTMPKPKTIAPTRRVFPPLASLGQASTAVPLALAAPSSPVLSAPLPQSEVVIAAKSPVTAPLEEVQVEPIPPAVNPVSSDLTPVPQITPVSPEVSAGAAALTPIAPVSPEALPELTPTGVVEAELPNQTSESSLSKPADVSTEVTGANPGQPTEMVPVADNQLPQPANASVELPDLTTQPAVSPLQPIPAAAPAQEVPAPKVADVPADQSPEVTTQPVASVPEVSAPKASTNVVVPTESASSPTNEPKSTASLPEERVYTRQSSTEPTVQAPSVLPDAQAKAMPVVPVQAAESSEVQVPKVSRTTVNTPMPPQQLAQPISNRLTTTPQVQQLFLKAGERSSSTVTQSWRELTPREALSAVTAKELLPFTRQLAQAAYAQAYAQIAKQSDTPPAYGFIDHQRRLIVLPASFATAVSKMQQAQSTKMPSILAQHAVAL